MLIIDLTEENTLFTVLIAIPLFINQSLNLAPSELEISLIFYFRVPKTLNYIF